MEYNSGSNQPNTKREADLKFGARLLPEVQLLINRNYNKIREEYDSGINYLTG